MKTLPSLLFLFISTLTAASLPPQQHPFPGSLPAMPPPPPPDNDDDPSHQPAVRLADVLGTQRSLTTFSSLARLHASTSSLLADLSTNTTVLAPLNSAIDALPRKPWEDPRDYGALGAGAYEGEGGRDRAQRNLRRFVEAHLVTQSPWEGRARTVSGGEREGEGGDKGGREVWWEWRGDKRVVMPDGVEVEKVASQVANGELWILKGVLNYA
ncbi:hypothetical protein ACO1O0_003911 [Amphichorda felina]